MPKKPTIFQRLDKLVTGNWETATPSTPHINKYDMSQGSDIIYKTTNKDDYEHKKLELQQNKYLQDRWIKANTDLSVTAYAGLNNIKLMYRDADLMDAFPEIGAALDIVSEESCLRGNTEVILADGESITIEELYSKNYKDFSLLAVDDDGNIQTTLVKGVIWKGKKSLYKITLEDDTEIYCTDDHQWMLSNVDWKETQYMVEGDSLMFIKDNAPAEIGVKNIELTNEIDNVYDLVDSSINSCFAVKTKSGQIISHNCITNSQGKVVNVYSKSDRVKSILEDLFVNRLNIQMTAQMIIRAMCKYGNQYMMLDIDKEKGVKGWKQLPVFNMERIENGIRNPFGGKILSNNKERNDLTTQFVWYDDSQAEVSFRDWQIAHFRLLSNSIYLPYGCIAGDAMIATEEGQKRMDEIQVGDKVWTFNIVTHNNELAEVTMFMPKGKKATYTLRTKDNEVKATPDHKFLIYRKNEFVYRELRDIRRGDRVVFKNDKVHPFNKLEKVTCVIRNGENEVYDFTVSNQNSNFFANGIVVHNCSYLNSARRHWRMLSLMEDMMLIYRLERSVERRVYKIFVGAIDDADVQAYVEQIANNFKRTPIIDPLTGQVDLRKNILPVHKDTPIPLLDGRTITIEELAKEFEAGKENYVYSIQDKTLQVVPGKVVWCGKNYTAEELVKITLDDNTYMIMAPEHEVMLENGIKKRADELKEGELLMPFNGFNPLHNEMMAVAVQKLERVGGDDVYCMTVVGSHGEDDRHNFALKTWQEDGDISDNGVFVSNCIDNDIFIPVRDQNAPTPIDTLAAGQNMTAIDDIKFVQNKVCTALRIPKTFLNFEEATGDGKNLALLDIRFTRTVNRIQQAFLMELTKVAAIHLYLLGFDDELTNFSLTMNNPSTQAEQLEIDNLAKKLAAVRDAVSDPGNGIPAMSLTRALKEIMKWSEKEIKDNFEEIRLEKGISAELEKTSQIIKKTGVFDTVDRIYGEPGAKYMDDAETGGGQGEMPGGGGGIGGGVGGGFGDGLDALGAPGGEEEGAIGGEEGNMPLGDLAAGGGEPEAPGGEAPAPETPMESFKPKKPLLTENKNLETLFSQYIKKMGNEQRRAKEVKIERSKVYDDSVMINEEFDKMIDSLNKYVKDDD